MDRGPGRGFDGHSRFGAKTASVSGPIGLPRPATAGSTRPWPMGPMPNTGWTWRSSWAVRRSTTAPLVAAGRLDFLMAGNLLLSFDNTRNGIPTQVVAAFFQRDPQILMAHSGQYDSWEELASAPTVLISRDGQFSFWQWLTATQGFTDEQLRPYGFNLAQFLQDETIVQQGYCHVRAALCRGARGRCRCVHARRLRLVHLLDHHRDPYRADRDEPRSGAALHRCLDHRGGTISCTVIGPAAYELIMRDNPDATLALARRSNSNRWCGLGSSIPAMRSSLASAQWTWVASRSFLALAENAGIIPEDTVDVEAAATDRFVNRGVGLDFRARSRDLSSPLTRRSAPMRLLNLSFATRAPAQFRGPAILARVRRRTFRDAGHTLRIRDLYAGRLPTPGPGVEPDWNGIAILSASRRRTSKRNPTRVDDLTCGQRG